MIKANSVLLAVVCLAGHAALAQETETALTQADTSSPRATLQSFIDACNEFHRVKQDAWHFDRRSSLHRPVVRRIVDCLDTRELPDFAREDIAGQAAVCLKEILDRVPLPPFEEIPAEDTENFEELSRWRIPGTRITIGKVEEGPQKHEFLFTPGTVARAVDNYEELEHLAYRTTGPDVSPGLYRWYSSAPGHPVIASVVSRLPEWTRDRKYGLAVWQWIAMLIALLIAIVIMTLAYWIQGRLASRWRETHAGRYGLTILFSVGAALVPLLFSHVVETDLTVRGTPLYVTSFIANLVALVGAIIVVLAGSTRIAAIIIASPQVNPKGLNAQLIRIACKVGSIAAAVVIFLEGGRYLGIPVTTLLASAGIGGLAIALAAQDSLRTLFGTLMLLADKPFRVGERIVFGRYDGEVEEIGLRSTRIRLLTGHLACIPNDELTRTDVENVGRRSHIRHTATICLPSDTPPAKVRRALEIVRTALDHHEGMEDEYPPRVFLRDLNESSVGIAIWYWYHPPEYWEYLAFTEKLNLRIMEELEADGIPFAAPALTVHTADLRRSGLNAGSGVTRDD
jgi:MscS family membrane protein